MKKIISIFLVLTVIFMTVFSANAFDAATESDVTPYTTKTALLFNNLSEANTVSMKLSKPRNLFGFISVDNEMESSIKNGMFATHLNYGYEKRIIVVKNEILYLNSSLLPFVCFKKIVDTRALCCYNIFAHSIII